MWLTTHPPETRPTPRPRLSELIFSSCSKPVSSTTTASSGDASKRTSRPAHTSRNFFATAHQEWRELQTTTAGAVFQSGNHAYQSANKAYQNETVEAIVNLATATASDRASVAALTATNITLTADSTATHSQLLITLQDFSKLRVTVTDLQKQLSAAGIKSSSSSPNHYCWMCGT